MPSRSKLEWIKNVVEPSLKSFKERLPRFSLTSGTEIQPVYKSEDLPGIKLEESLIHIPILIVIAEGKAGIYFS